LRSLGATHAFDYRSATLVQDILTATGGEKIGRAVDVIAARPSLNAIAQVVGPGSTLAVLLPFKDGETVTNAVDSGMSMEPPASLRESTPGVTIVPVSTFNFQQDEYVRENLMPKILPELLQKRLVQPNKVRLIRDGTLKERVLEGLDLLRNNKISGEKVVVQIKD